MESHLGRNLSGELSVPRQPPVSWGALVADWAHTLRLGWSATNTSAGRCCSTEQARFLSPGYCQCPTASCSSRRWSPPASDTPASPALSAWILESALRLSSDTTHPQSHSRSDPGVASRQWSCLAGSNFDLSPGSSFLLAASLLRTGQCNLAGSRRWAQDCGSITVAGWSSPNSDLADPLACPLSGCLLAKALNWLHGTLLEQTHMPYSTPTLNQAALFYQQGLIVSLTGLDRLDFRQINLSWHWYSFYRPLITFHFLTAVRVRTCYPLRSSTLRSCPCLASTELSAIVWKLAQWLVEPAEQ